MDNNQLEKEKLEKVTESTKNYTGRNSNLES